MITRSRIVISGMFEPIAHELRESGVVTVERHNAAHVFFTMRDQVLGLARPTEDGWAVELLVTDRSGGVATTVLADQLNAHFEDYIVSGPVELPSPGPAVSAGLATSERTKRLECSGPGDQGLRSVPSGTRVTLRESPGRVTAEPRDAVANESRRVDPGRTPSSAWHHSVELAGPIQVADGLAYQSPLSARADSRSVS